jgi:flagellar hook-basal body complex protein FliE
MQKEGELMSLRTSNTTNVEGVKAASEASKKTVSTPEEFQSILCEKIGSIQDTLEEMRAQREAINTVKAEGMVTEVVRRYMPDGSIMITQYVGSKIKKLNFKFYPILMN